MNQLVLNIKNESIMDKLLWMLDHFKSDGVEISGIKTVDKEYIDKNWREIGMNTHSADLDDNDVKYEAYRVFYAEKHSS